MTTDAARIAELEAEVASLKEEMSVRQVRIWAASTAIQMTAVNGANWTAAAAKLEAYLYGSHVSNVDGILNPPALKLHERKKAATEPAARED